MIIYLIAGPPGIGKSTHSKAFIPAGVPIIDHDLAAYQYKKRGFTDYQDAASLASNQRIQSFLADRQDFALELNLGFPSHYTFLQSLARYHPANRIHLVLFFTDDINLCLDRAAIRFLNGGHEVKAEVIKEMYQHTLPLLQEHRSLFQEIRLIDVTYNTVTELTLPQKHLPPWIRDIHF